MLKFIYVYFVYFSNLYLCNNYNNPVRIEMEFGKYLRAKYKRSSLSFSDQLGQISIDVRVRMRSRFQPGATISEA